METKRIWIFRHVEHGESNTKATLKVDINSHATHFVATALQTKIGMEFTSVRDALKCIHHRQDYANVNVNATMAGSWALAIAFPFA